MHSGLDLRRWSGNPKVVLTRHRRREGGKIPEMDVIVMAQGHPVRDLGIRYICMATYEDLKQLKHMVLT
jgi:hypothetical protein